ncbi:MULTISPECIES: DUF397 domain-containing protein [unclassified Saccharopolyspora]|uniref:DUF397 domain-containing protein n=1 Tax=unclassified Saccharopolyspora TaxID=2646250 RepID=UPI001CD7EBB8|nr:MULTISPECIES: DUF397 domain-containing protein [unclassified Saccharopolyspora]MCA1190074.1 DUF397 domain-containing protein [Saccharopolyspora sp. 6T]MCA1193237.1 DUF397 domain-containing protein [Saccharopolyspora sp. 6V]MCA1229461.1 DUF397 domain-containing protein [Saccharopolyspora sp. 6M]MCA1279654.1 DUF397 domain-containing protein [Saccharopolyspora sp. 7B]
MSDWVWRKSSRSNAYHNCVEVALSPTSVAVRDSKDRAAGSLSFSTRNWRRFLAGLDAGRSGGEPDDG